MRRSKFTGQQIDYAIRQVTLPTFASCFLSTVKRPPSSSVHFDPCASDEHDHPLKQVAHKTMQRRSRATMGAQEHQVSVTSRFRASGDMVGNESSRQTKTRLFPGVASAAAIAVAYRSKRAFKIAP